MALISVGNTVGLFALLSLIPLILLYLIRPKPKVIGVPSLMFFMKSVGRTRLTSFLRQFTRDWLFLIQLLILFLLSFSIADPFTTYAHDITASNTAIVLDVSASSQVAEDGKTRFEKAVAKAKSSIGRKNTIILAKNIPFIGVQDVDINDALEYLNTVQPTESISKIGDAMILAGEVLSGEEGRVVVISDFVNTGGQDPEIAKGILQSKELVVDFINVAEGKKSNVGFANLELTESSTTVYVKNFDEQPRTTTLTVGAQKKQLSIAPQSVETYSFQNLHGVAKLELDIKDDFPVDNILHISYPSGENVRVLLVANNRSVFLENALKASGIVELTIAEPPVIPKEEFDVYIIHNVDMNEVLPGTFEEIGQKVDKGGSLVVYAQEESPKIDYKGLLPVKIAGVGDRSPVIVNQLNRFTKNMDFGILEHYFITEPRVEVTNILSVDNSSILSLSQKGNGRVVYYGILESASDFKFSPSYPIFWTEIIKYLTDIEDINSVNFDTGDTLIIERPVKIETPKKILNQNNLILEDAGIYKLGTKVLAVNLLNELESDVNAVAGAGAKSIEYELKPVKENRKFYFELVFLTASFILVFLELLYIKARGDV